MNVVLGCRIYDFGHSVPDVWVGEDFSQDWSACGKYLHRVSSVLLLQQPQLQQQQREAPRKSVSGSREDRAATSTQMCRIAAADAPNAAAHPAGGSRPAVASEEVLLQG